jgi:hypothetical protein
MAAPVDAHPPAPPVEEETGYIERAVIWLRDRVVELANRIFDFLKQMLGYSRVDPKEKHRQFLANVNTLGPIGLQRAFKAYFPEEERKQIYERIAKDVILTRDRRATGEQMANQDPYLLIDYLREAAQLEIDKV